MGYGGATPRKLKVHRGQGFVEKRDGKFFSVTEGGRGGFGNFQRDVIVECSLTQGASKILRHGKKFVRDKFVTGYQFAVLSVCAENLSLFLNNCLDSSEAEKKFWGVFDGNQFATFFLRAVFCESLFVLFQKHFCV